MGRSTGDRYRRASAAVCLTAAQALGREPNPKIRQLPDASVGAYAWLERIDQPILQEQPMNHQLNYMLALQHIADLQRSADRARLASEVDARRRDSPDSNPITRLNARISRLTQRPASPGLRNANDPAWPPRTRDPILDMSPPTEPARANVP